MKNYDVKDIRNIALVGHGSCGKTSLGEAILYKSGATGRLGSVDQGNSVLDYDPEEVKRKISINLATAHFERDGKLFNVIDTPGYLDFAGEVSAALRVADLAVFVVNLAEGVEVGTEKYWAVAKKYSVPSLVFVNRMKTEEADIDQVLGQIKELFGAAATPVQVPVGKGGAFKGVFDLLQGKPEEAPEEVRERAAEAKESLTESIIELSEELLEKYLGGEGIPQEDLAKALRTGIASGEFIPILFGEAKDALGVEELLNFVAQYGPAPSDRAPEKAKKGEEEVELPCDPSGPFTAFVFKTLSEAHLGELYLVKVYSGTLRAGVEVLNSTTGRVEKVNQMFVLRGKERKDTGILSAGMIGALVKLKETRTNHTLCDRNNPVVLEPTEFPAPSISLAILPKSREDEEKVSEGLAKMRYEDPTLEFTYNSELKQSIISGLGELHLDVIVSRLKEKFGVSIDTTRPRVAFRETIRKPAQAMGKYVKQTGGRGQYGICYIRIEPKPRGEGYEFVDEIFGGAIPQGFIPSVEAGIKKAMEAGVLAKCPVVDVKVTLYDGKYHPVDSSNIAFEIAGSLAFKEAESQADPYLLEPIQEVVVEVPEEYMGDVIGDLNARRGKILGMDSLGRTQRIRAHVPLVEMHRYSSTLRSITKGRGTFTMKFSHYEEVPRELAPKMIEQARKEREEEEAK